MSHKITPLAYETKLGNCTAKSLLFCIADAANQEGYGWSRIETLAEQTELSVRQVHRLVQVFQSLGLMQKVKGPTDKHRYGFQLNVDLLGTDLRAQFREVFQAAQGKLEVSPETQDSKSPTVLETKTYDAETKTDVSETKTSVSETKPPDPLIGGTGNEPLDEPLGTASSPSPAAKGTKQAKVPDLRHTPFRELLAAYWKSKNPTLEMPWGKPEAGALSLILSASPNLTAEQFRQLLHNRWKSEVNHSDRPCLWLHKVLSYASGHIDRFGNLISTTGGNHGNNRARPSTKESRTLEALAAVIAKDESRSSSVGHGDAAQRGVGAEQPGHVHRKVIDATR